MNPRSNDSFVDNRFSLLEKWQQIECTFYDSVKNSLSNDDDRSSLTDIFKKALIFEEVQDLPENVQEQSSMIEKLIASTPEENAFLKILASYQALNRIKSGIYAALRPDQQKQIKQQLAILDELATKGELTKTLESLNKKSVNFSLIRNKWLSENFHNSSLFNEPFEAYLNFKKDELTAGQELAEGASMKEVLDFYTIYDEKATKYLLSQASNFTENENKELKKLESDFRDTFNVTYLISTFKDSKKILSETPQEIPGDDNNELNDEIVSLTQSIQYHVKAIQDHVEAIQGISLTDKIEEYQASLAAATKKRNEFQAEFTAYVHANRKKLVINLMSANDDKRMTEVAKAEEQFDNLVASNPNTASPIFSDPKFKAEVLSTAIKNKKDDFTNIFNSSLANFEYLARVRTEAQRYEATLKKRRGFRANEQVNITSKLSENTPITLGHKYSLCNHILTTIDSVGDTPDTNSETVVTKLKGMENKERILTAHRDDAGHRLLLAIITLGISEMLKSTGFWKPKSARLHNTLQKTPMPHDEHQLVPQSGWSNK